MSTEHCLPGSGDGAAPANGSHETPSGEGRKLTSSLSKKTGRDRVSDVAETGAADTKGEAVGTVIQKNIDTKVCLHQVLISQYSVTVSCGSWPA